MYKIRFSVLSYYPSAITNENINVGILFHNLSTGEREFYTMKNWKRLESFDDELDVEFLKKYLYGMKKEIEIDLLSNDKIFVFKDYIKYYVNELRFGLIQEVNVEDIDEFITLTRKIYMRLDFNKKERLSKHSELKYIKTMLQSKEIKYSSNPTSGLYEEVVQFDLVIGQFGFKVFTFEGKKNYAHMIPSAKAWAFTAHSLKDKYKTVFIIDVEKDDSNNYKIIEKILSEHAHKILFSSEVVDFVLQSQVHQEQICISF